MRIREALTEAEATLASGAHPERAQQDAEFLLLRALAKDKAWLLGHRDEDLSREAEKRLQLWLARRKAGEPVQYILGETEFYGLPFRVAPGVLIPRPETEHLVEAVLRLLAAVPSPSIADIGTGSGAIAVALAHARPDARVTAVDISREALKIATENAERNGVAERIRFFAGDLLAPLAGERFDCIASNPPYVARDDRDVLAVEVREHEPALALYGGAEGLEAYRRLIPSSRGQLFAGGWLALEIGYGQRKAIEAMLLAAGYDPISFVADYQGIARVALARNPTQL